jgi:hypothetical protein
MGLGAGARTSGEQPDVRQVPIPELCSGFLTEWLAAHVPACLDATSPSGVCLPALHRGNHAMKLALITAIILASSGIAYAGFCVLCPF